MLIGNFFSHKGKRRNPDQTSLVRISSFPLMRLKKKSVEKFSKKFWPMLTVSKELFFHFFEDTSYISAPFSLGTVLFREKNCSFSVKELF